MATTTRSARRDTEPPAPLTLPDRAVTATIEVHPVDKPATWTKAKIRLDYSRPAEIDPQTWADAMPDPDWIAATQQRLADQEATGSAVIRYGPPVRNADGQFVPGLQRLDAFTVAGGTLRYGVEHDDWRHAWTEAWRVPIGWHAHLQRVANARNAIRERERRRRVEKHAEILAKIESGLTPREEFLINTAVERTLATLGSTEGKTP